MKKLTVKQAPQLAAERDTDAFMEDMVHQNAHRILDLFADLHAQFQQERVKSLMYQEALEAIVSGGDMAWQLDGENSYTLAMCRIANAALQALSAPQAQAGEGK